MSDFLKEYPEAIRSEAARIMDECRDHDQMNADLAALWLQHADALRVPLGAKIAVTSEVVALHQKWGWDGEWLRKLTDASYMVVSEYRGGGPCVTFPDGTWDGGMNFDLVLRCRQAWLQSGDAS